MKLNDIGRGRFWFCLLPALAVTHCPHIATAGDNPTVAGSHWIWIESERPTNEVALTCNVEAPADIVAAELQLAVNNTSAEVRVNQTVVCIVEDFSPTVRIDLRRHLRTGPNAISLLCRSSQPQAGIQCRLTLQGADGSNRVYPSNPSWSAHGASVLAGSAPIGPASMLEVVSLGTDPDALGHNGERSIEISPFDDYEQWKQALEIDNADHESFLIPDGFEIERLRTATADESSWISLEFDPQGRLLVAREDHGLLRMTFSSDGSAIDRVAPVAAAADLQECRGLAFLGPDLYVNANNSKGLYRLQDTTGDGELDAATLIREFPGGVGHGRNDLAVHQGLLYSIHGDSVDIPHTDINDLTSPAREARQGDKTSEGSLVSFDPVENRWTLVAAGLRNPFGVAVHPRDGTLFTYDADAEHDMGAPWYRPTRVIQLQPGGDYGWRGVTGKWPPYYPDHADNTPPVMDIGKGSPTAVKFGAASRFPAPFREALYVLDWAYGRVLAVHLHPRGAGYTGTAEVFLRGRPLNVTDLAFGPDGAMYLVTGGRKTQSALYRIHYTGPVDPQLSEAISPQRAPVDWDDLDSLDPQRRSQARLRLEQEPTGPDGRPVWRAQAFAESRPLAAFSALMTLARRGDRADLLAILSRLNTLLSGNMSASEKLTALQAYSLCLKHLEEIPADLHTATRSKLESIYPDPAPPTFTPIGLGGPVNHRLAELLDGLDSSALVEQTLPLLHVAESQADRMHYLFVLRKIDVGWTLDRHREYFAALSALESRYHGGRGMPDFLKSIREEAVARLSESERGTLGALIQSPSGPAEEPLPPRPVVREWKLQDIPQLTTASPRTADPVAGARLFREVACSRCHRVGIDGSSFGPDLTGVAGRFSRGDILRSIIDPAAVVAEIYRNVEVVTADGRVLVGQVVTSGDYRDTLLRLQTDPLRPSQVIEISKADIEFHRESRTSPMPSGLLNTLTAPEIDDLLAYLQSGGGAVPQPVPSR